jgi:hypothetical protein
VITKMSKPGTLPGKIRRPTIETQTHIAHAEIHLKIWHLGQPFACGVGLLLLGSFFHYWFAGLGTAILVGLAGLLITFVDFRLRMTRIFWEARVIGPVTILACTAWLTVLILLGWSKLIFLAWLLGWIVISLVWILWMLGGEHKDENRQFPIAAANAGMDGVRFSNLRRRRGGGDDDPSGGGGGARQQKPGLRLLFRRRDKLPQQFQPAQDGWAAASAGYGPHAGGPGSGLIGTMELPPGEITVANAMAKIDNLESAFGHPPGSWSLAGDPKNAAKTTVLITDPEGLDREPLPWPYGMAGSRPGASIAEPINPGLWQDGRLMEYVLLRHHLRTIGMTDSGKTMTAAWNFIGEGITRFDYACLAMDVGKGRQFLGPLEPALHRLATTPEQVFELIAAIKRIRLARTDYLSKKRLTEWAPGCGLMFLNLWMEEVADIADLLVNRELGGSKERMEEWKAEVRLIRSVGARWDISTARDDFQEIPTMIRSQMGKMSFGVNSVAEAALGLSDGQKLRGARPQLWGTKVPGKFVIDAPSIPEDRIAMPGRGWFWGRDAEMIAVFAEQHPAAERPLDDVTGEALEAVPGPAATTAFPVTAAAGGFAPPAAAEAPEPTGDDPVPGVQRGLFIVPEGFRPPKLTKPQTLDIIRNEIVRMRREWNKPSRQLLERRAFKHLAVQIGRTEQHVGNLLTELAANPANGLVKHTSGTRVKWEILPDAAEQHGGSKQ